MHWIIVEKTPVQENATMDLLNEYIAMIKVADIPTSSTTSKSGIEHAS